MKAPIVILDANNLLHRYFHGPTQIHNGRNVNAVRGITALVGRLWRLFSPVAVVAAFDAGDSGRSLLLPAYKAHREGAPPELTYQIGLAQKYLPTDFQTDVVRAEGYEADDVIVTLAGVSSAQGVEVVVVSNDKDLTCIVRDESPRVTIYSVDGLKFKQVDAAAVRDRLGVSPSNVIDYLALCGDASDGVAGVAGIGPKSAAELLGKFGSLDNILAKLEEIERPRWRQLLSEGREQALQARRVLTPVQVPGAVLHAGTTLARRPAP
jgi:DNA polymerase-1